MAPRTKRTTTDMRDMLPRQSMSLPEKSLVKMAPSSADPGAVARKSKAAFGWELAKRPAEETKRIPIFMLADRARGQKSRPAGWHLRKG